MKNFLHLLIASSLVSFQSIAQVSVQNLLTENRENPVGVDVYQPRFSWQLSSNERNLIQTGYEIRVGEDGNTLPNNNKLIWTSGKVQSDSSVHVSYQGPELKSGAKYYWQVRVWDNKNKTSSWSEPASWQMGLLRSSDWKARWIKQGFQEDTVLRPSPMFRKVFAAPKKILSAIAFITARGVYEAEINGHRIGDAYLTPGWTSYNKRLQYQVYDVTPLLKQGDNAMGVTLGSGWYRGYIGFTNNRNFYGHELALLVQLEINYSDGSRETIGTHDSWKSSSGPIRSAEIYNGEYYDARESKPGWSTPDYNDKDWAGVQRANYPYDNLIATYSEPIRKHEIFKPVRIITTPKGEKVIDFGQNLVGWVIMKAKGHPGDHITISHAEVLDKNGNFYTENLRAAKAQDEFVLKGESEENFEPHFTFHGFRYIRVEGYPGELNSDNFTAVTLYSDLKRTGSFSCSEPLINQLQHNIQWGQKGNFLDVPTDCPQRDERLGWTGDAQVFSRTAAYNMNVNDFFSKWLKDLSADQGTNGAVPFVIPNVLNVAIGSTGWADVATIIPWNMWLAYGDKRILENQYSSMKAWVDYMHYQSKNNLWNTGFHFGDWLFYRPDDDNDGRAAVTDKYLIAQCFFARSTQILINTARLLNKPDDVAFYSALLEKIKDAFLKEYMTPNGRLVSGTQTAYVLALQFDMLPDSLREQAANRLVQNVHSYGNHLTTGFLGTPYLCHVLSRFGHTDVAYQLLLQKTYPSWLYPVTMGATTIWERWDGLKPDSTFQNPGMNSFNHYAYGAIGDWMYRVIAGMDTYEDQPGYKHIKIAPHTGEGLTSADGDLQTYYGKLSSHWKMENGQFNLEVEIPANTRANVFVPAGSPDKIKADGQPLNGNKDIKVIANANGYVELSLGSGKYAFVVLN
ncbi:MAG: alpha-L-rhamnosidase [Bacteroidetes bacterium]|nr:MAG: alpha-L-rhamnosidase [Bacteroidota bacterium]